MINSPIPEKAARIIDAIIGLNESSNTSELPVIFGMPKKSINMLNTNSRVKNIVRVVIRFMFSAILSSSMIDCDKAINPAHTINFILMYFKAVYRVISESLFPF